MRKSGDVAILMSKNEIRYLVGNEILEVKQLAIYSDIVCEFLDSLSRELRNDVDARKFPDILTFAFWCRKANIVKLKEAYHTNYPRIGKGMVFHIAPSNVPINFAFSLAFGMLAGNANVVRVSEKQYQQTEIVCSNLQKLLERSEFVILRNQIQVVSYGHIKEWNDYYSAKCSMRVVWGGDTAITEIRQSPLPPRATEITFADRFSFAILNEDAIVALGESEITKLAEKFYNDTYLMDQNACSSPHLIFWKSGNESGRGKQLFWSALYEVAQKYELSEKKVLDKYTLLCENAALLQEIESVSQYNNLLYVVHLSKIPQEMEVLRGKFGLFYEAYLENIKDICDRITEKMQTCVTYGMDNAELYQIFTENHIAGIDRIVPVGEAMNIGVDWDGYDVIGSLSRTVVIG